MIPFCQYVYIITILYILYRPLLNIYTMFIYISLDYIYIYITSSYLLIYLYILCLTIISFFLFAKYLTINTMSKYIHTPTYLNIYLPITLLFLCVHISTYGYGIIYTINIFRRYYIEIYNCWKYIRYRTIHIT